MRTCSGCRQGKADDAFKKAGPRGLFLTCTECHARRTATRVRNRQAQPSVGNMIVDNSLNVQLSLILSLYK